MQTTTRLVEVLRATLLEVEQSSGVGADGPALIALKQILLRRIADLELEALEPLAETAAPESGTPASVTELPSSPAANETRADPKTRPE